MGMCLLGKNVFVSGFVSISCIQGKGQGFVSHYWALSIPTHHHGFITQTK